MKKEIERDLLSLDPKEWALVIRTCQNDGTSYNGFKWPGDIDVEVSAPDWKPTAACGNGLHGLADGWGDWTLLGDVDATWQVLKVKRSEMIEISEKVKFPRCLQVYVGDMATAMGLISKWQVKLLCAAATSVPSTIAATGDLSDGGERRKKIGSSGDAAKIGSSGDAAKIGSSGDAAKIGSSGDAAQIGSSGYAAKIGSSGYAAKIGSSGDAAQIGSSGDAAKIGSSGDAAQIGSSGYAAQIEALGEGASVACAALGAIVSVGLNGSVAAAYRDPSGRIRFAVGYEGEGLAAGLWYKVSSEGKFVEVKR